MSRPSPSRRGRAPARTNLLAEDGAAIIGRVVDRAALADLFDEGARLVSVIGPGGMGKTRLATSFAAEQIAAYSGFGDGGVWFCDLTHAHTPTAFAAGVAEVLGVRLDPSEAPGRLVEHLGTALQRRGRLLLVLDNFEQLASLAAATLGVLLRAAPRARILVTTRIALELPGEHRWPLQGLALPPLPPPSRDTLLAVESVDLFVRRARQVRPDLLLDAAAVAAIADLASRLDGIPLAIELAAARVSALSPEQIRERLVAGRDDLLVRPRDEGRHASMRGVIAGSLRLLDEEARTCLLVSAVFRGGFTLAALDAVAGRPALAPLEALLGHSLVRALPRAEQNGAPRFSLYEVIRELAEAELGARPALAAETELRHAQHFAERARSLAAGPPHEARARLAADLENLYRAHASASAAARGGDASAARDALSIAIAVHAVARPRGLLATCLALLDESISVARGLSRGSIFAEALIRRGRVQADLGDFEAAAGDLSESLALARGGDVGLEAFALISQGIIVELRGATEAAREAFAAALACARRAPDRVVGLAREAEARACLAHTHRREGRLAAADAEVAAAIDAFRALGDEEGLASMIFEAGVLALFRERHQEAAQRFEDALGRARRLGAHQREAAILTAWGTLDQELGHLDRAAELHEAAAAVFRDAGNVYAQASTLHYLAGCHQERGQRDDAAALYTTALALVRTVGVPRYEALMLGALATIRAAAGQQGEAARLLGEAEAAASPCGTEPTILATLAIHRLHLRLFAEDAPEAARAALVAEAHALAWAHTCDDPRFAYRVLSQAAARREAPGAEGAPLLVVRAEGKGFRLPTAGDVDLSRRAPLSRIVHALARRRIEAPGEPLRLEDLLAAGWPGEKVRYDAGANRVYVALAELRKLGLRDWMVTDETGYRLSTTRPVVLEAFHDGAASGPKPRPPVEAPVRGRG